MKKNKTNFNNKNGTNLLSKKSKISKSKSDNKFLQKMILGTGVIILVFISVVGFSIMQKSQERKEATISINGTDISELEYNFYYNSNVNNFLSSYGDYLEMVGLDKSKPLSAQNYNDTMTWEEYFQKQTLENLQEIVLLANKADEENIKIDLDKQYDEYLANLTTYAKENNVNVSSYLSQLYGSDINEKTAKPIMERYFKSQAYTTDKKDKLKPNEDEIKKYYEENKNDFDTVSYRILNFNVSSDENKSEEDLNKEYEENKTKATEIFERIYDEESFVERAKDLNKDVKDYNVDTETLHSDVMKSSVSSKDHADWLFDATRKKNATVILTNDESKSVSILFFLERKQKDYNLVNARHILVQPETDSEGNISDEAWKKAEENVNSIYEEWKKDATEDNFITLAKAKSKDSGSASNGGLYTNIAKGDMIEEFDNWIFSKDRKAGDNEIIKTSYGYHIMYFTSKGETAWKYDVSNAIVNNKYTEFLTELKKETNIIDKKGKIKFLTKNGIVKNKESSLSDILEKEEKTDSENK